MCIGQKRNEGNEMRREGCQLSKVEKREKDENGKKGDRKGYRKGEESEKRKMAGLEGLEGGKREEKGTKSKREFEAKCVQQLQTGKRIYAKKKKTSKDERDVCQDEVKGYDGWPRVLGSWRRRGLVDWRIGCGGLDMLNGVRAVSPICPCFFSFRGRLNV